MPIATNLFAAAILFAGTSTTPPAAWATRAFDSVRPAAQQDLHDPPLPRWGTEGFSQRYKRLLRAIEAEVAARPDHEWAGTYSRRSFGLGEWMVLAPESGFLQLSMACSRAGSATHGHVTTNEWGQVVLAQVRPAGETARPPEAYWPVSWGPRRYLVRTDKVAEFANGVNSGELAQNMSWTLGSTLYERSDSGEEPVKGLPDAPPEIASLLLSQPLEARLSWVADQAESRHERTSRFPVRLDKGKRGGIFVGMELYVRVDVWTAHAVVEVLNVGPGWAEGSLRIYGELEPRAGMTLTSRSMSVIALEEHTMQLAAAGARATVHR